MSSKAQEKELCSLQGICSVASLLFSFFFSFFSFFFFPFFSPLFSTSLPKGAEPCGNKWFCVVYLQIMIFHTEPPFEGL